MVPTLIIPVIPVAFGLQAFLATWPMYLGLNRDLSRPTMLVLGLVVTATNLALPLYCANSRLAQTYRAQRDHRRPQVTGYALSGA